jgi:polyphosphate kinase
MTDEDYAEQLRELQIALVRTQIELIEKSAKVLVVLEGRDAAGKDGVIQRITEHLSPRNTRVAALPKPSDRERSQWYFQRYSAHLPACTEIVLFNRSWYNRAGVEPVMGFCTPQEHAQFLKDAPSFEHMLQEAGIKLVKFWLDISKSEQALRLKARRTDPLKTLKVSPLDAEAQKRWKAYTAARDEMLMATSTLEAPWICVRNDHKKAGRIGLIRHLLGEIAPRKIARKAGKPDPDVVFRFEPEALKDGRLER